MKKAPTIGLLMLTLLLGACSAPLSTATPPEPTAELPTGLYELKLQGQEMTVTALPSRAGLQTQALEEVSTGIKLTGPLSVATSTDTALKTRHVRSTFKVTNTTNGTLNLLRFLPVDTNLKSGVTSSPSKPTIGDTPFHSVALFDGSDASVKAGLLIPTWAKTFNPSTGTTEIDYEANSFLTGLDVSTLAVSHPGDLDVVVKNYGWGVAGYLLPGASTNVTFAVDLNNVDPARPAADPYTFTLVFAATQDRSPEAIALSTRNYLRRAATAALIHQIDSLGNLLTPTDCTDPRLGMGSVLPDFITACQVIQPADGSYETYGYATSVSGISYQWTNNQITDNTSPTFPPYTPFVPSS